MSGLSASVNSSVESQPHSVPMWPCYIMLLGYSVDSFAMTMATNGDCVWSKPDLPSRCTYQLGASSMDESPHAHKPKCGS